MTTENVAPSADISPFVRKTAIVTGASSGIGAAFSVALARRGHALVLTGRRTTPLEQVAEECRSCGVPVRTVLVELSDPQARRDFIASLPDDEPISIVVANAGFGFSQAFVGGEIEPVRRMIEVHVTAVVELFHAVLPGMQNRGDGALIAVSSLASLLPVPGAESYVASKSYLNSFCESLGLAVRHRGITVQTLLPGFTRTDFHRYDPAFADAQPRFLRWMTPEAVAATSLRYMDRRRPVCIPGWSNRVTARLLGALPRVLVRALMGSMRTREHGGPTVGLDEADTHQADAGGADRP